MTHWIDLRQNEQAQQVAQRHRGFTVIELLIVLAIIGLLILLLLPAIQQAREMARTADCQNRLAQIAHGLHQYHSARQQFPAGVIVREPAVCDGSLAQEGMGWMIAILPFIEEQALYQAYDDSELNEAAANQSIRSTPVAVYNCPADPLSGQSQVPGMGPAMNGKLNLPYTTASYRGVSGRSEGTSYLDSATAVIYPSNYRGALHAVGSMLPGFSAESFKTVKDGTSKTLMIGESSSVTSPAMHSLWAYSYEFYSLSAMTRQARSVSSDYDTCVNRGGTGGPWPCQRGWESCHSRLLNFAFVDASVHPILTSADVIVLAKMATIDGGESVE